MTKIRYRQIYNELKSGIQTGKYPLDTYLPSEHELCATYSITRTTARKALDELLNEGFIEKRHGKGSRVRERRNSLGLLNVKGFSEAVGYNVKTIFLRKPEFREWNHHFAYQIEENEMHYPCIYFERLRCVEDEPVMYEKNWFSSKYLKGFMTQKFVEGSFFKTLSQKYLIEITGSEQELRANLAYKGTAKLLKVKPGSPVLYISIRFSTSQSDLHIYSELICNTQRFPIGNSYFM